MRPLQRSGRCQLRPDPSFHIGLQKHGFRPCSGHVAHDFGNRYVLYPKHVPRWKANWGSPGVAGLVPDVMKASRHLFLVPIWQFSPDGTTGAADGCCRPLADRPTSC
jgi:hypothetical protein